MDPIILSKWPIWLDALLCFHLKGALIQSQLIKKIYFQPGFKFFKQICLYLMVNNVNFRILAL